MPTARLFPLFLACFASIGYEIALTRFFALSSWSEYGYWIISIAMVGLAASGTAAALAARPLVRLARPVLVLLPVLMIVAATVGWHWTTLVPFNPLELQNRQLWGAQLVNIAECYAALFPFFFLVGLYVSLVFVLNASQIGRVYAADLAGAGLGAVAVLALMTWRRRSSSSPAFCRRWRSRPGSRLGPMPRAAGSASSPSPSSCRARRASRC
jgi:hypothetical protein